MNAAFRGWPPSAGLVATCSASAVPPAAPKRLAPTVPSLLSPDPWMGHLFPRGPHRRSKKSFPHTLTVDLVFCNPRVTFDRSPSASCLLPMTHFTDEETETGWDGVGRAGIGIQRRRRGTPGVLPRPDDGNFEAGGV